MHMTAFIALGIAVAALLPLLAIAWIARSSKPVARTVRRAVVHLPVVQHPTTQRLAAAVGAIPTTCATCEKFDLRAGQEVFDKNPAFKEAAHWLSPSQMGQTKKGGEAAQSVKIGEPDAQQLRWENFGVCSHFSELRAKSQTNCKEWT